MCIEKSSQELFIAQLEYLLNPQQKYSKRFHLPLREGGGGGGGRLSADIL